MSELSVVNAKHITGHILDIEFNDGHISTVDFATFIFSVGHPDYEAYKKIDGFLNFDIVDGNINWDDYTMIFPVEDLYKNKIIKHS
ncbi:MULTISPECIES: DUF2442 domain-containing protein [unclassified Pseudoalteromonas]|uniref:DUF2442 domain-containing protein n=1 Tax=unclassified Pseudoalteromonas TaxID=194690 RepID=UPI002573CFAA|nr:DUF2442 domain-containing protein [Pseudoalteromonas sp. MM1]BED91322.1 hypothetical protein PspMM1_37900 [Pseudoalteromonas sp. MM1]